MIYVLFLNCHKVYAYTIHPSIHLDLMYLFMSLQKSLSLCVFWLYINKNSRGTDGKNKEQYFSYFQERHLVDSCQFLELKHHTMIGNSKILDTSEAESVLLYFVNFFIVLYSIRASKSCSIFLDTTMMF